MSETIYGTELDGSTLLKKILRFICKSHGLEISTWVTSPEYAQHNVWAICKDQVDSKSVMFSVWGTDDPYDTGGRLGEMGVIGEPDYARLEHYIRDVIAAGDIIYYQEVYDSLIFEEA